jgi:hypothetical protein
MSYFEKPFIKYFIVIGFRSGWWQLVIMISVCSAFSTHVKRDLVTKFGDGNIQDVNSIIHFFFHSKYHLGIILLNQSNTSRIFVTLFLFILGLGPRIGST